MAKRDDIESILIIGSGPIKIGQACEFDYSGSQAIKALKEDGYRIILINSNPATIMTDVEFADRTYIEPLTADFVEKVIDIERPDGILATLGGQTALNLAMELDKRDVYKRYRTKLLGVTPDIIDRTEDRKRFKEIVESIGLEVLKSLYVSNTRQALDAVEYVGFPAIIRPSYTLGGSGAFVAYNINEFRDFVEKALNESPVSKVLIEESALGWKEFEMEVIRDRADNTVIVCSIENISPMGVHTGDSVTVAPAQTLSDREYQRMRDASIAIMKAIGIDTGGSNIQFAIHPRTGRMVVIEMNPRVSRSSALASKATGFPIARVAAKLAVGYTLDELTNEITKRSSVAFEPSLDYVVIKAPRFDFNKFPGTERQLTTQMKSVGEVMAIGRTFKEALQKAFFSLEKGYNGILPRIEKTQSGLVIVEDRKLDLEEARDLLRLKLRTHREDTLFDVMDAFALGLSPDEVSSATKIDPWFISQMYEIFVEFNHLRQTRKIRLDRDKMYRLKQSGFSDRAIADALGMLESDIRRMRHSMEIKAVYKRIDTCAAEFEAYTPYVYSTYESECESLPADCKKIIILGSGPNRIGQGIEFDYCCVKAAEGFKEEGYQTIMVNCNPETVSTDYDVVDRLYFEPLTLEHVLRIIELEKPDGVVLQFGGQTPLKLAMDLNRLNIPIMGTQPDVIDIAEDRKRFESLINLLGLKKPESHTASSLDEALHIVESMGFPIIIRPSYVIGGQWMEIFHDSEGLESLITSALKVSQGRPILIDRFLADAVEVDVDLICDGRDTLIGGIMEHIEEAGVHSGDSTCILPPVHLKESIIQEIERESRLLATELGVVGLMNIQFAVKDNQVFVLEVNPRSSRSVPFVSKATGIPMAKLAAKIISGKSLKELGYSERLRPDHVAVKSVVFPFKKFPGTDILLGPQMKSTGESMGISKDFPEAFYKAQLGAENPIPLGGTVFISVKDRDKERVIEVAKELVNMHFKVIATSGTASYLEKANIPVERVNKVSEGRPHVVDRMVNGDIDMVINTAEGRQAIKDSYVIRRHTLLHNIPYFVNLEMARAAVKSIKRLRESGVSVRPIQDYLLDYHRYYTA